MGMFCSCACAFDTLLREHPFHARNLQQALDVLQPMMAQASLCVQAGALPFRNG